MPGVWRAVAYCEGMVVIFHSPRACAHVARTMDINSQYRSLADGRPEEVGSVPLLSSQLEEKHSIFGGVERLEQCIAYAVEHYKPQCLAIANSCVAGVIGDDVNSVAVASEDKYGIPVLTVDCCGFLDGEYYQGYFDMTRQLLRRFIKPCAKEKDTVLLIGDNGGPWGHYATEVTRLLHKMGIKVIGQFPGYMKFSDLSKAGRAEAMIILGGRGNTYKGLHDIAEEMQQTLAMPYLDIYPVCWSETQRWITAAGELLHKEKEAQIVLAEEQAAFTERLTQLQEVTRGKKTVLCIGRLLMYYHPKAVLETIRLLQLNLTAIILLQTYGEKDKADMLAVVRQYSDVDVDVYDNVAGEPFLQEADIVLTTHELQNKYLKQLFLPMLPKAGRAGEIEFMEAVYRTLCSRIKGGLTYV